MIASVQTGGKNEALESMRGLCALFIVLLHDSANNFLSDNAFINNSHVAVDFFFVLSGYVIALSYAERIDDWRQMGGFMRRRLLRIYPLHLFVLLAFVGIESLKYLAEIRFGVVAHTPAFSASNLENFLINLALLQGVLPDPVAFNPPSWSISVEFMTYAAFALAVLTRRTGALILAALLASLVFILRYHDGHLNDGDSYQLIRCIWSFAIGYFVYRFQSLSVRFGSVSQAVLFAICGLAVIYAASTELEVMVPLLFGLMVLSLVNRQLALSKVLRLRPLVYFGAISYSVYMVHSLVYWFTTQTFRFVVPVFGFERWDHMNSILFTLISVGLTIAVAHVTYHRIEMRFFKPRTAIAPDAEPATVLPVRDASEASR